MGSGWINSPSTQARMGRESMIRAGYQTGYYKPMVVPMGSYPAMPTHTPEGEPFTITATLDPAFVEREQRKFAILTATAVAAAAGVVYWFVTGSRT